MSEVNDDLDALEALAKGATPGPWEAARNDSLQPANALDVWGRAGSNLVASDVEADDGRFIAAASPDVVLDLIAEVRRLEKMLDVCAVVHEHNVKLKSRLDAFASDGDPSIANKIQRLVDAETAHLEAARDKARSELFELGVLILEETGYDDTNPADAVRRCAAARDEAILRGNNYARAIDEYGARK